MNEQDHRPQGARVTLDMIGSRSDEQTVSWSEKDAMLYALGVGAGIDADLSLVTENTAGVSLTCLPSFVTVLGGGQPPAMTTLDIARFLHGSQKIELAGTLPPEGEGIMSSVIDEILDKGSGAIVSYSTTLRLAGSGEVIARSTTSIFIRGAGGFGGPRGEASPFVLPERDSDVTLTLRTRPEQALLYRLCGDRHRLHSDPQFARECGFDRPIMHGLCTYGFACRALIEAMSPGVPQSLRSFEARFSKPAYPGEALTFRIWDLGAGRALFQGLNEAGTVVLDAGVAQFGAA